MHTTDILYGIHPSPYGTVVLGMSGRGVCRLAFLERPSDAAAQRALRERYPHALLTRDDAGTAGPAAAVFRGGGVHLDLQGTPFQMRVWAALRKIRAGATRTYGDIARAVGAPGASRAVGAACGANPVAFAVPCHRVVASDGSLGGYRWGLARKKAMLAAERHT